MSQVALAARRLWDDPDRRRALLLSVAVHLCIFLVVMLWLARPTPVPLEQYIVLDLGSPQQSSEVTNAATVDAPAPTSPTPQVADDETGEPQARTAEQEDTTAPEPDVRSEQPVVPPAPQAQSQADQADQAEASPPVTEESEAQQSEPEPALAEAQDPPLVAPAPQLREPTPEAAAPDLPEAAPATVLPEIEQVAIEPLPNERPLAIPQPQAAARLPEARAIAPTPSVQVRAAQEIPTPDVSVEVTEAQVIPQPQAQAQVAEAQPVPQPQASATVAESVTIPSPQATARVSEAAAVPSPQVSAQVTPSRAVPTPSVAAEVAGARAVPVPGASAEVAPALPLTVEPQAAVDRPVQVPEPSIAARVVAPEIDPGAAMAGVAPEGPAENPSNRLDDRIAGGNAERAGQDRAADDADADNLGLATAAEGDATGADSQGPRLPFREVRERPLAVLLDNHLGYPQAGLAEASVIAEMPVEGGITRLMTLYDVRDPEQVGPVRSARDYFVSLAQGYNGVLVHDGGSPGALAAIGRGTVPSINAYSSGDLFQRGSDRNAPYNLYANGVSLRQAVNRLALDNRAELVGVVPRPPEQSASAERVEVRYGTYTSGFLYVPRLNNYRWVRNGQAAVDFRGEAVSVDAVLVAHIDARPIPDDPAGRLYIPLRSGEATLHLNGRAIPGSWRPASSAGEGVVFETEEEERLDLEPFRIWLLFAPGNATVTTQ